MVELNRRHLLLGGVASLAGAAALPALSAGPAFADSSGWAQVTFSGIPGGGELVAYGGPFGILGATYAQRGAIVDQARMDVSSSGVKYWTKTPLRGRGLPEQQQPLNTATAGMFGMPVSHERYRINVNGFGIIVWGDTTQYVNAQVVGANGQANYLHVRRWDNPSSIQSLVNTFIDQTNTLNLQYRTYQNTIRQYVAGFAPAVTAGIAGLIVTGANPLTIVALIAAAATAGVAAVGAIANAQNTYMTTYNQMIETYERLFTAFDLDGVDIARYQVGGVRWNNVNRQLVQQPEYAVIQVSNP